MPLLTDDLRSRLPPLLSQEAEGDPMVFARYSLAGTGLAWYVGVFDLVFLTALWLFGEYLLEE